MHVDVWGGGGGYDNIYVFHTNKNIYILDTTEINKYTHISCNNNLKFFIIKERFDITYTMFHIENVFNYTTVYDFLTISYQ